MPSRLAIIQLADQSDRYFGRTLAAIRTARSQLGR